MKTDISATTVKLNLLDLRDVAIIAMKRSQWEIESKLVEIQHQKLPISVQSTAQLASAAKDLETASMIFHAIDAGMTREEILVVK
jgi:hypothetical protein